MRARRSVGVGHLFPSGELGHSLRIYNRRVLYLIHREGLVGEHDLGVFTGDGWVDRLVDALLAVFDRISPPNSGWGSGARAKDRSSGQVFTVRLVQDTRGPGRHWPDPRAVQLFDGQSRRHSAADCDRVGTTA